MSVKNFVPSFWAEIIDQALKEFLVFYDFCNHEYEGKLKKAGDAIRIQNVARPTITTTTDGEEITLSGAEKPQSTSVTLNVLRQSYFNYGIYDVDKAQKVGNLEQVLKDETTQGVANEIDLAIANVAKEPQAVKLYNAAKKVDVTNVLDMLDEAQQKLYEANVPANETVEAVLTPRFYTLFRRAYQHLDTQNSEILKNGKIGMYGNMTIKMSNNVATENSGATDLIMVRTKKAIAAVETVTETEAYRPEEGFVDAVKGLTVHDRKLVRPKELAVINCKYA